MLYTCFLALFAFAFVAIADPGLSFKATNGDSCRFDFISTTGVKSNCDFDAPNLASHTDIQNLINDIHGPICASKLDSSTTLAHDGVHSHSEFSFCKYNCPAGMYKGDNNCEPCTSLCPEAGEELTGTCDGSGTSDTKQCSSCSGLPAGHEWKSGEGCNSGCPAGMSQGVNNCVCPAGMYKGVNNCETCTSSCPEAGEELTGTCDGTGTSDTMQCSSCSGLLDGHEWKSGEGCDSWEMKAPILVARNKKCAHAYDLGELTVSDNDIDATLAECRALAVNSPISHFFSTFFQVNDWQFRESWGTGNKIYCKACILHSDLRSDLYKRFEFRMLLGAMGADRDLSSECCWQRDLRSDLYMTD